MDALHFERLELKYFVPEARTDDVRRFIEPYVRADDFAAGMPGTRYAIHNVYLDTPRRDFYRACLEGAARRTKLRIRWYDEAASGPFFLEVKRKVDGVVVKDRVMATRDEVREVLDGRTPAAASTLDRGDWRSFLGRMTTTGATPVIRVQYTREAYESVFGEYARITFDRAIRFQEVLGDPLAEAPHAWGFADSAPSMKGIGRATVLELKVNVGAIPRWMSDLVRFFDLRRTGFSKYATSVGLATAAERGHADATRCAMVGG